MITRLNNAAIALAADLFSEWVSDGDVYKIDHSCDPPWDNSGRLVKVESNEASRAAMYATLGEWMDDCHEGNSSATFQSGCGLHHDTFSSQIQDDVRSLAEQLLLKERGIDPETDDAIELVADDAVEIWVAALQATEDIATELALEIARSQARGLPSTPS